MNCCDLKFDGKKSGSHFCEGMVVNIFDNLSGVWSKGEKEYLLVDFGFGLLKSEPTRAQSSCGATDASSISMLRRKAQELTLKVVYVVG
ncbi:hypothetical protein QQP08_026985 [Theobroma cacao]|nr:hypothetical protein QQP08_026985 [Theobroma cacao]